MTIHRPRIIRAIGLALALLCAAPLAAQDADDAALPDWQHTSINDFAGLLTDADTRTLDEALIALHAETGVEGTVVTLTDRASYGGSDGLERFATRLFNHWGVGDAQRNDGFMVLVLPGDRETRIELGSGYPRAANRTAADIMDRDMLPAFRDGDYSAGIRAGTMAVIDRIARPHAAGQPVPERSGGGGALPGIALFAAGAAAMFGMARWNTRRRNRCPQCGHQGLETTTDPLREPQPDGGWRTATGTRTRRCPACGWQDSATIPLGAITYFDHLGNRTRVERMHRPGGSSGFGGGSSSGGGASGRW